MVTEQLKRRLVAIMAVDVVAYSRMMEIDEVGTVDSLKSIHSRVLLPTISLHGGRVVKLMGDGAIVEFVSVTDAVVSAVTIQKAARADQQDVASDRQIVFRIGINSGDVIVDGDDLLGGGVNIAARLEALAEPGSIYISEAVHEQLTGQMKLTFENVGEHILKNIVQPIRVWRWSENQVVVQSPPGVNPKVAVLPFHNLGAQADDGYLSDGITEDIITALARFRSLAVIARNSSFSFRDQSLDVAQIGRRLGASHIVQGSVRRSERRIRITVQLIEAASGAHLWAERYDRDMQDLFALQQEVSQTIVATMFGRIEASKLQHSFNLPTRNFDAYGCVLRGLAHLRGFGSDDNEQAFRLFEKAVELDPAYAAAHAFAGMAALHRPARTAAMEGADYPLERALTALTLDPQDSRCHGTLAIIRLHRGEYELAEHHAQQAIVLNPSAADEIALLAMVMNVRGRPDEALEYFDQAKHLNPFHPQYHYGIKAGAYFLLRRYNEAIDSYKLVPGLSSSLRSRLAACYAQSGDLGEAKRHAQLLQQERPGAGANYYVEERFV
jgi:adenylate cyclase